MEQRCWAAGSKSQLLFWLTINLLVLATLTSAAARWKQPRYPGPPQYMLKIGAEVRASSPQVGETAPAFTLPTLDGAREVSLADFHGDRPVVLIFGSYTCPIFRGRFDAVNEAYAEYKGRAQFLFVYIREAHPEEDGIIPENESLDPVRQHQNLQDRTRTAQTCTAALKAQMTTLVDRMDDSVANRYQAWPERLYVIDQRGAVAYCGSGPGDFSAAAMTNALTRLLSADDKTASGHKSALP